MIIGHIGAAFGARRIWPRVPLTLLLVATFLPDLLRPAFIPFGMQSDYSNVYTHAFPWCVMLAAAASGGAWLWTRRRDASLAVGTLVLLHVVFDVVSGTKKLWDGGPRGLNIDQRYWQYEFLIELALAMGGWWLARQALGVKWQRKRVVVLLALLELVVLIYPINDRPYLSRCLAYPFRDCEEVGGFLTQKWRFLPNFGLGRLTGTRP